MAVAQGVDALAFKPTLSGPEEERLAAAQLRERTQNAVETPFAVRSVRPSNLSISDELRQAKQQSALSNAKPLEMNNTQGKEKFDSSLKGIKGLMSNFHNQATTAKLSSGKSPDISKTPGTGVGMPVPRIKNAVEDAVVAPISRATSEALKQSWLNLIDSYGLTLLYINFHVFSRFVFGPKMFCKLGHEWVGKTGSKEAGGIFGMPFDALGLAEAALLIILDALVVAVIFISILPYLVLAAMLQNPTDLMWVDFGAMLDVVKAYLGL